jgi:hypothetical protein
MFRAMIRRVRRTVCFDERRGSGRAGRQKMQTKFSARVAPPPPPPCGLDDMLLEQQLCHQRLVILYSIHKPPNSHSQP